MTDRTATRRAIAMLSKPHRAVLYRAYYLKRTTTQIAADLNLTEDVVRSTLHGAMRELRGILIGVDVAV